MKIHLRRAEAWIWFTNDQPRAAGGFYAETAKRLGEEFEFFDIGVATRSDQQQMWVANRGSMKPSRTGGKKVKILAARGVETDLSVEVQGDSDDAHTILDAVWHSLAGEDAENVESLGKVFDRTMMVVEFPFDFGAAFPIAGLTRRLVSEKLREASGREPREPQFRMGVDFVAEVGRLGIARNVRFEPRVSSAGPGSFYTESPMRSEDHVRWLEAIEEAHRSGKTGTA